MIRQACNGILKCDAGLSPPSGDLFPVKRRGFIHMRFSFNQMHAPAVVHEWQLPEMVVTAFSMISCIAYVPVGKEVKGCSREEGQRLFLFLRGSTTLIFVYVFELRFAVRILVLQLWDYPEIMLHELIIGGLCIWFLFEKLLEISKI